MTSPDDDYECSRCQRNQHSRCTDPDCSCCGGNVE